MRTNILFLYGIIFLLCLSVNVSAQNYVDTLPKDPLDSIWERSAPVRNSDLSFLIEEDSCYDFCIREIFSLPSGYIILVKSQINNYNVWAYIVTPKICPDIKYIQKRIKRRENYKLHLRRYFLLPARAGIEYGKTVDVMLGKKTISINENGYYSYLFTSFDIEGLNQIKSKEILRRKLKFKQEEYKIKNSIVPFLEYISYGIQSNNLFNTMDTLQIKRSLNRYGFGVWGRNPSDFDYPEKKYKWSLDYPVEKYDWMKRDKINPEKFQEIFWTMLKTYYCLPIDNQIKDSNFLYSSIQLKLLYFSNPNIYTVQVIWKLPDVNKTFIAILNIQKKKNVYKIIGFNRAYAGYGLDIQEGNERYVPY